MDIKNESSIVVSGMRSSGALHLGHYHGVITNWLKLQNNYKCYFFAADLHALTTRKATNSMPISNSTIELIKTWLACGVSPDNSTIFVQSMVPEHAELHLMLSMVTPVSWLERVPTYKEQKLNLNDTDLNHYGFLGYPLLQAADILLYKANLVPVGEDQVSHVELTREIARKFNYVYGQTPEYLEKLDIALSRLGKKDKKLYIKLVEEFKREGDKSIYVQADNLVTNSKNLSNENKLALQTNIKSAGEQILKEPQSLLTKTAKMPGLDGRKMSKSYNNTIDILATEEQVALSLKKMPTDPARIKRTDKGDPHKCPVWDFHKLYSNEDTKSWVLDGCKSASIGCIECKAKVADNINDSLSTIQKKYKELNKDNDYVMDIILNGVNQAKEQASHTLNEVKKYMELVF